MAITLVPAMNGTSIDPDGNTFGTLDEANTYFTNRVNGSDWTAISTDEAKKQLLLYAMNPFQNLGWIGGLVQETQPLSWPRVAIRPTERRSRNRIRTGFETLTGASGGLYDKNNRFWSAEAIPVPVKNAQFEQALSLHKFSQSSSPIATRYKRWEVQNQDGVIEMDVSATGKMSSQAMELLKPFLFTGGGMSRIFRG